MSLEFYRLPLGLTKGVEIPLPQTEVSFTVMLPGNSNEEFSSQLMVKMNSLNAITSSEDEGTEGMIKVDPSTFTKVRKDLFFETCIIAAEGLPDGMDMKEFFSEYPLAKKYLMEQANQLAQEADKQVYASMEKLSPTQNGKSFGKVGKPNTKNSSAMASQ